MSILIQCDADDCYAVDGISDETVFSVSEKAKVEIKNKLDTNVEHLCEKCMDIMNEYYQDTFYPDEEYNESNDMIKVTKNKYNTIIDLV